MWIRRTLLLTLPTCLTACASVTLNGTSGQTKAQLFSISENSIILNAGSLQKEFLRCEGSSDFCYTDGILSIVVPKNCPDSVIDFYSKDKRFSVVGYIHGYTTIKFSGNNEFMFVYSEAFGIGKIYWDFAKTGSLVDRGSDRGIDGILAEKLAFVPTQTSKNLQCNSQRLGT